MAFSLSRLFAPRRECIELATCRVYVYRPVSSAEEPRPGLLWMHGGGLIMGHPLQEDTRLQGLADDLGIVVAAVQYRLAPENPFPAALDDCDAAFDWLARQAEVDPARVGVGGVSAGGGLAAALCQRRRTAGGVQPAVQVLVYPMLDDRSSEGTHPNDEDLRVWNRATNRLGWDSYLLGQDRTHPPEHAVPGRTEEVRGLPPAWIGVGTVDLFHDEDVAYAERLSRAGVPVQLEVVDGAYHGFDVVDPDASVTRAFQAAQRSALQRHLLQDEEA